MTSAVRWERPTPGVLLVSMRQPPANPLGPAIVDGLTAALDEAGGQPGTKVVVLESGLDGFFAAGADIKHMAGIDAASFVEYGDGLRAVLARLAGSDRVTIAAVEGLALGGGLEVAMGCTMRVAGRSAAFGLPEVQLGLIPGAGGTQRLPRLVGRGRALDMMLTARQVPAEEAFGIGLVDRLVDAGQARAAALGLAGRLCRMSAPALAAVIRTVDAAYDVPLAEGLRIEADEVRRLFEHGEAAEGIAAFVAKRRPNFD